MNKEETLLQKRLIELSRTAYLRGIVMFSDFLNLNELNILHTTPKHQFQSQYMTYGGYGLSERQMVAFLPDALYAFSDLEDTLEYPFQVLEISPLNKRFSEELSHRDYLGAVMNLGIERCKLGDIMVEGNRGILFVKEELSDYIRENLTRIRHTSVMVSLSPDFPEDYEPKYEEIKGTVASIRLDTVLSLAFPLSRSKLTAYIEGAKVFVNGKLITSNGYRLKEGDMISVRKMGRILYGGILSETKKGRYLTVVRKYI
ncbi:MAG: RNA-binding protein [Dorea sp.]|nr:RNA-binding protein [Dorea sp.]